jgi:hypothetical protein
MNLNELLLLIHETPATVAVALDELMAAHGYVAVAARDLHQDFTPLLVTDDGGIAFVLSQPREDWIACFTSLDATDLWAIVEELARVLAQPILLVLIAADQDIVAYRFFEEGRLRAELEPEPGAAPALDQAGLIELVKRHGVPVELLYDRVEYFGQEHLGIAYARQAV